MRHLFIGSVLRGAAPGAVKPSPRPSYASTALRLRAARVIPLGSDLASPVLAARAGVQARLKPKGEH